MIFERNQNNDENLPFFDKTYIVTLRDKLHTF